MAEPTLTPLFQPQFVQEIAERLHAGDGFEFFRIDEIGIECDRIGIAKKLHHAAVAVANAAAKQFSAEEKLACSIDAMRNGGTCEACQ